MPMVGERLSDSQLSEINVIGSLLISPEVIDIVDQSLAADDFGNDLCKCAYEAILDARENGESIDPVVVLGKMRENTKQDCTSWIMQVMDLTTTAKNIRSYCESVKKNSTAKKLIAIHDEIERSVYDFERPLDVAETAIARLEELHQEAQKDVLTSSDAAVAWSEYYDKVVKNPEFAFCRSGYRSLDRKLGGGMFRSGMYVVGARPGMGKTTLGINIADNIAKSGKPVLMISLEMDRTQVMAKRIAIENGTSYTSLMTAGLDQKGKAKAMEAAERLGDRPFYLTDISRKTAAEIGRACRSIKGLSCVLIDYLGLVKPNEADEQKPRYEQMTAISADLKALAKQLGVPIILLCQLNRENTKDKDKRPSMQHLRDSGSIEQDADAIILLHRSEYYNDEKLNENYKPPELEDIELIIAKNRHGETGTVFMQWRGETGEIREKHIVHENETAKNSFVPIESDEPLPF